MNCGYIGYSMSVRAAEAYQSGEKPLSKWSKADILAAVKAEYGAEARSAFAAFPVKVLRSHLLQEAGWHHTSSWYNETKFYCLPERTPEEIAATLEYCREHTERLKRQKAEPQPEAERRARCIYLEWTGTRKHPRAQEVEATGVIRGDWFYPDGENFKKSVKGNGFRVIEEM